MLHQLWDEIKYDMAEEENTRNTNHNIKNIDVMELRCKYFDLRLSPHSIYFPTMGWDEKVDKFGVKLSPEFIIKYLRWKFLYSDIMVWRVDDTGRNKYLYNSGAGREECGVRHRLDEEIWVPTEL